jgi:phosphatidylglycerophosphatase A
MSRNSTTVPYVYLDGESIVQVMMLKKFAYILGTGLGSGYVPFAPGTAGSFAALLIFYLFPLSDGYWLVLCVIFFMLGLWSSSLIEKEQGVKDPAQVVIDEWVGQWLALLFLPRSILILLADFALFRILDIIKPFPAGKLQNIKGGMGIMIDDIIAAVYVNVIMHILLQIQL